jgi:hypothetical protein
MRICLFVLLKAVRFNSLYQGAAVAGVPGFKHTTLDTALLNE